MNTLLLTLALLGCQPGTPDVIDSALICINRALATTPVTSVDIESEELRECEQSASLPMALGNQPSVVATNEGGTGLGYSHLRVRGVGATQTNVSLNGITLNDAESQQVFWVNIPGLGRSLSSVQLQRGLGISSAGVGDFGASVNLKTLDGSEALGGNVEIGYGSFNTLCLSAGASSGTTANGFYAAVQTTAAMTEGYIDGGTADVWSLLASVGWKSELRNVNFTYLHGQQISGITWEGCPWDKYPTDRTYNPAKGAFDNYWQNHYQLSYARRFIGMFKWNTVLNYSTGYGYYYYPGSISWTGVDTHDYLNNGLWALRSELMFDVGVFSQSFGIYGSSFGGRHYGTMESPARSSDSGAASDIWYDNDALKTEFDIWSRSEVRLGIFGLFADLQLRVPHHVMNGPDEYGAVLNENRTYCFFNPRLGSSLHLGYSRFYLSLAYASREPSRSDIQMRSEVSPEHMLDLELGWKYTRDLVQAAATFYDMSYFNMLVESSELDAAGYAVKYNVPRGRRLGLELCVDAYPFGNNDDVSPLILSANTTLSSNKIVDGGSLAKTGADILLSPSVIAGFQIGSKPWKGWRFAFGGKYVGRQYWDNSGIADRMIPDYFVSDLSASWKYRFFSPIRPQKGALHPALEAKLGVNNLFNAKYYAYAYSGGVFTAAPASVNFTLRFTF